MRDTHSSPGQGWNDYSNRALAGSFAAAECSFTFSTSES